MNINEIISKKILDHKPELKHGSIKTYVSVLKSLYKGINPNIKEIDLDFFEKNVDDIIAFINDKKPMNSRKTILSALYVLTKIQKYRDIMMIISNEVQSENRLMRRSKSQKDNWISKDDIKKIFLELEKNSKLLFRKNNLNRRELQELQQFIILSMFFLIAPRRLLDYTEMKIRSYNINEDNYFDGKNNLVFNKYKTAKFYGKQIVKIPIKLINIIKKWIEISENKSDFLFFDRNNHQLTPTQLNQRINSIFGRKISVDLLRHVYLSDKYTDTIVEMKEDAEDMGTSSSTIQSQYLKM